MVVAVRGRADDSSFVGLGRVAAIDRLPEGVEGFDSRVMVIDFIDWAVPEHELSVPQLAPSIPAVGNPFRPRGSLGHRRWIDVESVNVIRNGTLQPQRTAFFRLLTKFSPPWRAELLRAAVWLDREWREVDDGTRHAAQSAGVPLEALMHLLRTGIVSQVELAASIRERHEKLFPRLRGPVRLADEGGRGAPWDADGFLREAVEQRGIGVGLDEISARLSNEPAVEGWTDITAENEIFEELLR